MATKCEHLDFAADVSVGRILPSEGSKEVMCYQADVRIVCADCQTPFRFIGLPAGLDLNGAAVSVDGTEGRFAIAPKGEVVSMLEGGGPAGFTIRKGA